MLDRAIVFLKRSLATPDIAMGCLRRAVLSAVALA